MKTRIDDLLMALLILAMTIVTVIDRFAEVTSLSQTVIGILTALTILGAIVFIFRLSADSSQETQ